jgi:ribosomal subunit interface protein
MKISVTGRHMNVGESLRDHATTKLQEVTEKYFSRAIESHIVFDKHNHGFQTDIQVHVGRNIMVQGHGEADDAYIAFDMALSRVNGRLRRYKNKLKDTRSAPTHEEMAEMIEAQKFVLAGAGHEKSSEEAPEQPLVIAEMTTQIETLTVSEAVMRMDLSGYPAIVFKNKLGGGMNVIYRRPDGNIGWIDPSNTATSKKPAAKAS